MSTVSSDASRKHTVHRIVPTDRADDIKRLFLDNERPEFPQWFDRAYPIAIEKLGCTSWVTVDANDRVICHMSAFHSWFWVEDRVVQGTLLCNLMTDKDSRSFFPTVATIKRAVKDLRADGTNFIYTNPINKGSIAVMKAGGLKWVGDENRYLMPTGDERPVLDLGASLVLHVRRLTQPRLSLEEATPDDVVTWTTSQRCGVSDVSCKRYPEVYFMRYDHLDGGDTFGRFFLDSEGNRVGATMYRKGKERNATLITLRCLDAAHVGPAASALGLALRSEGIIRINTTALEDTDFSEGLRRGGFIQRKEPWTIAATAFTPEGEAVVAGLGDSDLEHIDVD